MGTNDCGVCACLFLVMCVQCAGLAGAQSELELGPVVRGAMEEVIQPSFEPCTSAAPKLREWPKLAMLWASKP